MRSASLKKRLGDILVNVGLITNEQLSEALNIQVQKGGKLGSILAQMGVVNEEVMLAFLGKQCGISYVSLSEFGTIPESTLRLLPEKLIRQHILIPIAKEGNSLTVAMSDPFNILAIDDIKLVSGFDIQVVITSESEIRAAIERCYANNAAFETMAAATTPGDDADAAARHIAGLLADSIKQCASEIYIEPQDDVVRVRYRKKGVLHDRFRMEAATAAELTRKLRADMGLKQQGRPEDGILQTSVDGAIRDFHIAFTPANRGERIYLKLLSTDPSLHDIGRLGMEQETLSLYRDALDVRPGVVLITGPQKSGCTTTLMATLAYLNQAERDTVYIDAEPRSMQGITRVKVRPHDGISMGDMIEAYVRQSPDVLACGEVRDANTAEVLFRAALSGQFVVAVMTASGTLDAITRLRNYGVAPSVIASTLLTVVNQRLVRTVCRHCMMSYAVPAGVMSTLGVDVPQGQENVTLYRGTGCAHCDESGYAGVAGVFELMNMSADIREKISKDRLHTTEGNRMPGTVSLPAEIWKKVGAGVTTAEEYLRLMK